MLLSRAKRYPFDYRFLRSYILLLFISLEEEFEFENNSIILRKYINELENNKD